MRKIEFIMGMPVIVEIVDAKDERVFSKIFEFFKYIDEKFSPYKQNSEVTKINDKRLSPSNASSDLKKILKLSQITKSETNGYFDVYNKNMLNPSGVVKGWAIYNASSILDDLGYINYCVEAGGDIQTKGFNKDGDKWTIGIKSPFNLKEIIKVIYLSGEGIATSGTYERGQHIYNPKRNNLNRHDSDILSITVIAPNIYEADRLATASFAMGKDGIKFVEKLDGFEGYLIDKNGIATMTSGFEKYAKSG